MNKLNVESLDEARESSRVAPALSAWVQCMAEKGHKYKDFYASAEDPRWAKSKTPSAAELETAEADVSCKERAGLVKLLTETEESIQKREIRRHKAYFESLAAAKERHLAAARAVIRRG